MNKREAIDITLSNLRELIADGNIEDALTELDGLEYLLKHK